MTVTPTLQPTIQPIEDAIRAIQQTIDRIRGCSEQEKIHLLDRKKQLEEFLYKLHHGKVEIVVIGEISTGKSALINALAGEKLAEVDVRGGWTKEVLRAEWKEYRLPGFDQSAVVLVDTPGLNEVNGEERAMMAKKAAEVADLVLFVTDSDLNEIEYQCIMELRRLAKPMIVVLNKADLLSREQKDRLLHVLREERLAGIVPPELVVPVSADPREQEYIIRQPDGREVTEWRKPMPNVAELKSRIVEILDREGLSMVALSASMFAKDASDEIVRVRMKYRNDFANKVIITWSVSRGLFVALLPYPVIDVCTGTLLDVVMVRTLAGIYDIPLDQSHAMGLVKSIGGSLALMIGGEYLTHLGCTLFKMATFGLGSALTLIPQAVAGAYGSYIVGHAAKYYLSQGGSWGDEDPRQVIRRILASVDKQSVTAQLKEEIQKALGRRPQTA